VRLLCGTFSPRQDLYACCLDPFTLAPNSARKISFGIATAGNGS
jgi:hypothetical protein